MSKNNEMKKLIENVFNHICWGDIVKDGFRNQADEYHSRTLLRLNHDKIKAWCLRNDYININDALQHLRIKISRVTTNKVLSALGDPTSFLMNKGQAPHALLIAIKIKGGREILVDAKKEDILAYMKGSDFKYLKKDMKASIKEEYLSKGGAEKELENVELGNKPSALWGTFTLQSEESPVASTVEEVESNTVNAVPPPPPNTTHQEYLDMLHAQIQTQQAQLNQTGFTGNATNLNDI